MIFKINFFFIFQLPNRLKIEVAMVAHPNNPQAQLNQKKEAR